MAKAPDSATGSILEEVASELRLVFDTGNPVEFGFSAAEVWRDMRTYAAEQIHVKEYSIDRRVLYARLGRGDGSIVETIKYMLSSGERPHMFTLEGKYAICAEDRIRYDLWAIRKMLSGQYEL
jgi:hypothetical protein